MKCCITTALGAKRITGGFVTKEIASGLLALLCVSCSGSTPLNSAFVVGGTSDGGRVTVDETSIRRSDGRVIAIERIFAPDGKPFPGGVTHQEYVLSFDCKSRKYETLDESWHFANGNVARMGARGAQDVIPNSPVEMVMNKVCS